MEEEEEEEESNDELGRESYSSFGSMGDDVGGEMPVPEDMLVMGYAVCYHDNDEPLGSIYVLVGWMYGQARRFRLYAIWQSLW